MRAVRQHALLVATRVREGHRAKLETLFQRMVDEQDVEDNSWVPFAHLRTVHFARFVILPPALDVRGRRLPCRLLFSTNYDGLLDEHLAELDRVAASGLDEIYRHCHGYPVGPTRTTRISYLRAHMKPYTAFYVGAVGRSVEQIRQESELRDAIQTFLDSRDDWSELEPSAIRAAIQDFVFEQERERFSWARNPAPPQLPLWVRAVRKSLLGIGFVLILLLLAAPILFGVSAIWVVVRSLGTFLVLAGFLLIVLRYKESHDGEFNPAHSCPETGLMSREDQIVQNQLTVVNNMKPGFFRLGVERLVQAVINFVARFFANEGNLGGIPSIHFARWALLDNGRRLLFMSNFDGSWENYLSDFVDKAAGGLTAVWSNTVHEGSEEGFPRTRWLVKDGARDEHRFKAYARASQLTTHVWYSAYKELTVQNINNNSMIRAGLYGDLSPEQTVRWLRRF